MNFTIIKGDLLEQKVDVIVNTWNRNFIPWWLLLPQGVSRAIKKKGGYKPFKELGKKGILSLGEAVLTSPGNLNFKAIIHVAGINFFWTATEKSIRLSTINSILLAENNCFQSIALPLIGAGTGRFPKEKVINIMKAEIEQLSIALEVIIVVK